MNGTEVETDDLEGKIVLISGDSDVSRSFRDDLFRDFEQDHQIGARVVRLNVQRLPYSNGEQNHRIIDPDGVLSMKQIKHLIRNSDTYFVGKIENPALSDPLKYHLDNLVAMFGRRYSELKSIQGVTDAELHSRFSSYVSFHLPQILGEVVDKNTLEDKLVNIADEILGLCRSYEEPLRSAYRDGLFNEERGPKKFDNIEVLKQFRYVLRGYLADIMNPRSKQISLDELQSVSKRIGRKILKGKCDGRLSWVTPFLDGRSDKNLVDPHEGIRAEELADDAATYNVKRVLLLRAHSFDQIRFLEENGIRVDNLTQTNEYISRLVQANIDFSKLYVLSPDKGGLADAMVFARELYRRTNGKFSGRVVVFDKKRVTAGKIAKMEFLESYVYERSQDSEADFNATDSSDHPIPYDHPKMYARTYKDKDSDYYVGRLFRKECGQEDVGRLKNLIEGHLATIRDDIIASGGTMLSASEEAFRLFSSRSIAMIEHACMTGNAIEKLDTAFKKGYLDRLYTSTSIEHPNQGTRPWHHRIVISRRFYSHIRRHYLAWLKENRPDFYKRLHEFDAKKRHHLPEYEEMVEVSEGVFDQPRDSDAPDTE
ncbi:hypothetical protein KY362_04930 [Candidatus Woesearchaeota archaeon]|nr:hypothetical protein [Candidatus Woesearchaeota archaeon]